MRQKRVNLKIKFLFVGTDSRVTNRSSTLSVNHRRLQTDLPPAADQRQDDAINRFRTLSMQYPELLCVENSFTNPSINRWFCLDPKKLGSPRVVWAQFALSLDSKAYQIMTLQISAICTSSINGFDSWSTAMSRDI